MHIETDEYKSVERQIWFICQEIRIGNLDETEGTEQILSIPGIAILADKQRLPPNIAELNSEFYDGFAMALVVIYEWNFRRII